MILKGISHCFFVWLSKYATKYESTYRQIGLWYLQLRYECNLKQINIIILQLETKAIVNVSVYCVFRVLFDPNLAKKSLFRGNEINTKMKSGNISISYVYLNEKLLIKIHLSSIRIIVLFFSTNQKRKQWNI